MFRHDLPRSLSLTNVLSLKILGFNTAFNTVAGASPGFRTLPKAERLLLMLAPSFLEVFFCFVHNVLWMMFFG